SSRGTSSTSSRAGKTAISRRPSTRPRSFTWTGGESEPSSADSVPAGPVPPDGAGLGSGAGNSHAGQHGSLEFRVAHRAPLRGEPLRVVADGDPQRRVVEFHQVRDGRGGLFR